MHLYRAEYKGLEGIWAPFPGGAGEWNESPLYAMSWRDRLDEEAKKRFRVVAVEVGQPFEVDKDLEIE